MIFFDTTKAAAVRHRSGLARMSSRLREQFRDEATACSWTEAQARATAKDWFITAELFSESERPGWGEFIRGKTCRTAAIFADAIPLKHPHITWPKSVARHPSYMKMLASFDRVWAISQASRDELVSYWAWLELKHTPPVEVLPLGADFDGRARVIEPIQATDDPVLPGFLCVGILEPRKNQLFLLEVCEALWSRGAKFELHLVGRVNPHFGAPIVMRIKALRRKFPWLHYHEAATDEVLARLYVTARATLCPTITEGCGLPLLESLWRGVPCVCSDLPVLRENADGGGCVPVPVNDHAAWVSALDGLLTDPVAAGRLAREARTRCLPTWAEAGAILRDGLR